MFMTFLEKIDNINLKLYSKSFIYDILYII